MKRTERCPNRKTASRLKLLLRTGKRWNILKTSSPRNTEGVGDIVCFFFFFGFFSLAFFTLCGIRELPLPFLANAEPQGFKSFFNYS